MPADAVERSYEYVIVGAGSGGIPLAAKLAKAGKTVLLMEAGPDSDWKGADVSGNAFDPLTPRDVISTLFAPDMNDAVMSEPTWQIPRGRDPRFCDLPDTNCTDNTMSFREFMPRARIVGGCTMHNFMINIRPSAEIFKAWGENWEWETLLPKLKAMEHNVESGGVDPAYHGFDGECYASNVELYGADREFLEAAVEAGHQLNHDFNGETRVGMGPWPKSIHNGSRWGTAQAFLTHDVRSLPNFEILTQAFATKIEFDGKRASGITYTQGGETKTVIAEKEVILCAGSFRSPQLLMLSGIGPSTLFDEYPELPQIVVSEGVGRNLQDHLMVNLPFGVLKEEATMGFGELAREDYDGAGLGGFFFSSWCQSRNCSYPDMQFMCGSSDGSVWNGSYPGTFSCAAALNGYMQSAAGWLTLKSLDPKEYPAIYPNYLEAQDDIDRLAEAVAHFVQDIVPLRPQTFDSSSLASLLGFSQTGGNFTEIVRARATTIWHPVGTAKMGPDADPLAVVDSKLRVRGVQGLRVGDASVMPLNPNVNTDVTARLIGFHLADMILEEEAEEPSTLETIVSILLPTIVVLVSLGLGATLTVEEVQKCFQRWQGPLIPMICQYGLMPPIAMGMAFALGVTQEQGLSFVVVACCPGGTTSNIFTYFSGSDVTLSLVATGLSNIMATLALPVLIPFYSGFFITNEGTIPMSAILTSVAMVIIPCSIGITVKRSSDVWSKRLEKIAGAGGAFSIVITIVLGGIANFDMFFSTWKLYAAGMTMMPIGGILGYNLGKCAGLPQKSCQALCFESGLQNALIGLTILELSFGPTSPVFKSASVFCYMYLFFIFIPHGFLMVAYFKTLPQEEEGDVEKDAAAELVKS